MSGCELFLLTVYHISVCAGLMFLTVKLFVFIWCTFGIQISPSLENILSYIVMKLLQVRFHPLCPDILASGSLDHEVRLWNAKTAECIGSRDFCNSSYPFFQLLLLFLFLLS